MAIQGRELGFYERYSLERTLAQVAPIISYIASLDKPPTIQQVSSAIDHLISLYPLLQCTIAEIHTRHPYYVHQPSISSDTIIRTTQSEGSLANLLKLELDEGKEIDVQRGPLWRVTLYEGSQHRLAITLNHTACDGLGGRNLLGQLLQLLPNTEELISDTLEGARNLPPSLESTIDVTPLPEPKTTGSKNSTEVERPIWPNPPLVIPYTRSSRVELITISAQDLPKIKAVGKSHGVQTLQPLLHTITLASLSATVDSKPIKVSTSTAVSLRDPDLGHPYATGNYVGDHSVTVQLDDSLLFWNNAREYATGLKDPVAIEKFRRSMGALRFLPDPDPMPFPGKTGWGVWIDEAKKGSKYTNSYEISNLGVIREDLDGVREVIFAQTPSPTWAGIILNPVASKNGPLTISIVWCDGIVEDETIHRLIHAFNTIVGQVADDEIREDSILGKVI